MPNGYGYNWHLTISMNSNDAQPFGFCSGLSELISRVTLYTLCSLSGNNQCMHEELTFCYG